MTTTVGRLSGQVAKILNRRELIINRGAEDGVEVGMMFAVLDRTASEVTDPETGEVLGAVHRPKVKVVVRRVEPRLSIAQAAAKRVNVGGFGVDWSGLSSIFAPPRYETRTETLETDEPMLDDLEEADRYVHTGDPVEQIFESEDPYLHGSNIRAATSTPTEGLTQ